MEIQEKEIDEAEMQKKKRRKKKGMDEMPKMIYIPDGSDSDDDQPVVLN